MTRLTAFVAFNYLIDPVDEWSMEAMREEVATMKNRFRSALRSLDTWTLTAFNPRYPTVSR